ncbi:MAG: alpha/beta hydrolase [Flavobacteriales bacterium]|nr:MAG: alpha/beta hydrolase [Flavobacteriales bacterium]
MPDSKRKHLNEQSKFIPIMGMDVHYRVEGNGPDLILVHGTFSSLHTFEKWVSHFKKSYRVTSFDLPGFGYTGAQPDANYELDTYISFFEELFMKLNINECILAGNSLGGMLCWEFALRYQSRVKKMILIDAVGFLDQWTLPKPFFLARNPILAKLMKLWMPRFFLDKKVKEVYANPSKVTPAILDRYFDLFVGEKNHLSFVDIVKQELKDNSDRLTELKIPTLILWGKRDRWIPVKIATLFANTIPNAELIIYDNCGHVPMEEIPEETIRDVSLFLE